MHHGVALTDPSNYSSPFVLILSSSLSSSATRRYDITGIGINLWLIHLHFIPEEPSTHARRRAYKHTDTPKRAQTLSKSSFFAAAHILRVPIHPSPSRRFKSDLQLSPISPRPARSTCSIEIPIAALSKALYDEGSHATQALSAVSSWYFTFIIIFQISQSILYRVETLLTKLWKKDSVGDFARKDLRSSISYCI